MSISVFAHFMRVACGLFDEVPLGKNEDDGYLFTMFLKESRLPPQSKNTKWETVRDIFGKYKVRGVSFPYACGFRMTHSSSSRSA